MKIIKTLAFAAILGGSLIATTGDADAAIPAQDFSFDYNPSLLASMDGRQEIRKNLKMEARDFCRRTTRSRQSLRQENRCNQIVIDDTVRQLSERYPSFGPLLVDAGTSYNMRDHRTGRSRR